MACFAPPFGLRYADHCFNRAHTQQSGSALIPAGGELGVTSVMLASDVEPGRSARINIMAVAMTLTILIGLSRLYLGVHWPSDVAAGWALGAGWALAWGLAAARYSLVSTS